MQTTKQVACNVFEYGLKKYSTTPEYVVHYIDYLTYFKDDGSQSIFFFFF